MDEEEEEDEEEEKEDGGKTSMKGIKDKAIYGCSILDVGIDATCFSGVDEEYRRKSKRS